MQLLFTHVFCFHCDAIDVAIGIFMERITRSKPIGQTSQNEMRFLVKEQRGSLLQVAEIKMAPTCEPRSRLHKDPILGFISFYDRTRARSGTIVSRSRRYIGAIGDLLIGFKCCKAVALQRVRRRRRCSTDRRTVISAFIARR